MASKLCDSCKSATATLFCRADSAFLCVSCDSKIHAANKLASRHARVWVCEVCEQAPAHVTCKADAAALCVTCDRDIHSANPLAQRHERVAVTPFYDSSGGRAAVKYVDERYLSEVEGDGGDEEEEAASWLVGNPGKVKNVFEEMEGYLDLDLEYGSVDPSLQATEHNSSATDGVVPHPPIANQHFQLDFASSKPYLYAPSFTQTVSSSSMDVGVVPDGSAMTDISNPYSGGLDAVNQTVPLSAVDREARVLRYREKRKNRKFEKTIRYASRKAYAETRPRIKGRFAKRTDIDVDVDRNSVYGFRVVPSF